MAFKMLVKRLNSPTYTHTNTNTYAYACTLIDSIIWFILIGYTLWSRINWNPSGQSGQISRCVGVLLHGVKRFCFLLFFFFSFVLCSFPFLFCSCVEEWVSLNDVKLKQWINIIETWIYRNESLKRASKVIPIILSPETNPICLIHSQTVIWSLCAWQIYALDVHIILAECYMYSSFMMKQSQWVSSHASIEINTFLWITFTNTNTTISKTVYPIDFISAIHDFNLHFIYTLCNNFLLVLYNKVQSIKI